MDAPAAQSIVTSKIIRKLDSAKNKILGSPEFLFSRRITILQARMLFSCRRSGDLAVGQSEGRRRRSAPYTSPHFRFFDLAVGHRWHPASHCGRRSLTFISSSGIRGVIGRPCRPRALTRRQGHRRVKGPGKVKPLSGSIPAFSRASTYPPLVGTAPVRRLPPGSVGVEYLLFNRPSKFRTP